MILIKIIRLGAFTYVVTKTTKNAVDPLAKDASYLPLQQELATERSEPKWDIAQGYDMGQINFVTRYNATGNPTSALPCSTVTLNSTAYYSFWKRYA
jgi:hypothetical protein